MKKVQFNEDKLEEIFWIEKLCFTDIVGEPRKGKDQGYYFVAQGRVARFEKFNHIFVLTKFFKIWKNINNLN